MIRIEVDLGERSYPVLVGRGAIEQLESVVPLRSKRAVVVTQRSIGVTCDPGVPFETIYIDDGEEAKSLRTVESLCRSFVRYGLTRADCVIACGGGLVTDLAGFAAAIYHRGTPVIHVSTTLLGQVDAAIGGKTGANLDEGKNLVGAFWQPSAVICDTATLDSLPERELLSGTGEMAKYYFLARQLGFDEDMTELSLEEKVARCVAMKAKVVASDEREGGERAILNYGHTLGHAIERSGGFELRHGEAVSIGIYFAAKLARRLGRIDDARVDHHLEVLHSHGLPVAMPSGDVEQLLALMKRDKKALDGLTFVLDSVEGVQQVNDVDEDVVRLTLEEMINAQ